jgi:hypothetical protein
MDHETQALTLEAIRIWNEYSLHAQGITYEMQGYVTADNVIPAWKIDEHLLASKFYEQVKPKPKKRGK